MNVQSVTLIILDDSLEAIAIRGCLEYWGVRVNMVFVAQPIDLVNHFNHQQSQEDLTIICGHGDEQGFHLPELAQTLREAQPFNERMSPANVETHLSLTGLTVVSTACLTGRPEMVAAFMAAGASSYIGPQGYPDGNSALFYSLHLLYNLVHNGLSLRESHDLATGHDAETALFRLTNV